MSSKLGTMVGVLFALLAVTAATVEFFDVPYDYADPGGDIMKLRYSQTGSSSDPVAFVVINDKYADYSSIASVFTDRFASRYSAEVFELAPRGWHELRGYKGTVMQLPLFTVENSLRDIDAFVKGVVNPDGTRKVVIAGNGHGATLAAFYRQEYESATVGAVVDTPIVGTSVLDAQEAESATLSISPELAEAFQNATATVAEMLDSGMGEKLLWPFDLCEAPDTSIPRLSAVFWYSVMHPIVRALGSTHNRSPKEKATFRNIESAMLARDDLVSNLGRAASLARETSVGCIPVDYGSFVKNFAADGDNIITLVGKCLELGTLPVPSTKQVFFPPNSGLSAEFFGDLCNSILGYKFNLDTLKKGAAAFESRYGGRFGYTGSNTFIVTSHSDPLITQTIATSLRNSNPFAAYSGRRGDVFRRETSGDSAEVKEIRFALERFLDTLLG